MLFAGFGSGNGLKATSGWHALCFTRVLMKLFAFIICSLLSLGAMSDLAEARSVNGVVCVTLSELAMAGAAMGDSLSGQSLGAGEIRKGQKSSKQAKEVQDWYDTLAVGSQSVLVQIKF